MLQHTNLMGTEQELAILFSDVVGSTQLYEKLGDDMARETVQQAVEQMKRATTENNGTVIKTMGDEVMATFENVQDAMLAATAMQVMSHESNEVSERAVRVNIRIGCHYGHVVAENNDVFGAAVHTANRLTSQAKASQIVISADSVERLGADWTESLRQICTVTLRGQSGEVALYEVLWSHEDTTSMLPEISNVMPAIPKVSKLRLRFQGQEVVLGEDKMRSVTMGRADDNDVTIKGNLISRLHARIELKRTHYELIDQSTNGTFLHKDGQEDVYLRRDFAILDGHGVIGLGRVADAESPLAIEYVLED